MNPELTAIGIIAFGALIAWIMTKIDKEKSAPPDPILECEILTYSEVEEKNFELLGISKEPNEAWLAFSIDLQKVIAIKLPSDSASGRPVAKPNECILYSENDSYVVNVPYHEVRRRWKEIKKSGLENRSLN